MNDEAVPARISQFSLHPAVAVAPGADRDEVARLAHLAHLGCYISISLSSAVKLDVTVVEA